MSFQFSTAKNVFLLKKVLSWNMACLFSKYLTTYLTLL